MLQLLISWMDAGIFTAASGSSTEYLARKRVLFPASESKVRTHIYQSETARLPLHADISETVAMAVAMNGCDEHSKTVGTVTLHASHRQRLSPGHKQRDDKKQHEKDSCL